MTPRQMPKLDRLAFLDALAQHLGHVERRNARERTAHRYGYGPTLVWSASSGTGTLLVMPYSSGSGVVRVHVNRYSEESRLLGWTAEITCMPDELEHLVPWLVGFIRARSMMQPLPPCELLGEMPSSLSGYFGLWTSRATAHEAVNGRTAQIVRSAS